MSASGLLLPAGLLTPGVRKAPVAGGGPAEFPSLGSLWSRYKADDEAGADNDPVVPQDISGNGRHAVQATSSFKPTLKTAIVNGKSVYRLDGVDDFFAIPDMSGLTGLTAYMVFKLANDPPASASKTGWWRLGSSGTGIHGPYTDGSIYDDAGVTARQTVGNPALSMASTFRRYCVTATGAGAFKAYLDDMGTAIYSTTGLTFGCTATPKFGNTPDYPDLDLAELVICSAALSAGDLADLDAYAESEYGL